MQDPRKSEPVCHGRAPAPAVGFSCPAPPLDDPRLLDVRMLLDGEMLRWVVTGSVCVVAESVQV